MGAGSVNAMSDSGLDIRVKEKKIKIIKRLTEKVGNKFKYRVWIVQ